MIAARGTAGRAALSLAQHTSLSILGTLAATAILAGLRTEWTTRPEAPPQQQAAAPPSLTSGGKFAARAEDGGDPESFVTLTLLPPGLPMLTTPTVPLSSATPALARAEEGATATGALPLAPSKPLRSLAARRDSKRVVTTQPQAPRHTAPTVIAMAALQDLSGAGVDRSLWSRSKTAYRQVAAWSGTLVDHLLP